MGFSGIAGKPLYCPSSLRFGAMITIEGCRQIRRTIGDVVRVLNNNAKRKITLSNREVPCTG